MVEQNTMPTMTSPGIKSLDESDLSSASEQLLANLTNFNGKSENSDNEDPSSPDNADSGVSTRMENMLDPKMLQKFFGNFPFRPSLQMNNPFFAAFQQQQLMNLNGVFGAGTSNPGSSRQTPERNEEDEDLENLNGAEPEDLSLGRLGKDKKNSDEDSGSMANSSYTFEEQFKQLYEVNDDPNRKAWLDDWFSFMNKIGKPVTRIPIMAKQVLDLYELYHLVIKHGGLVEIINKKLWREITKGLNLPASITSAAFTLRTQYQKYLYDYECDRMNLSTPADLTAAIEANKREGRRNPGPMMGNTSLSSGLGNGLMMNGNPGPGGHGFPGWGMPFFGKFGNPFGFKNDDENPLASLTNNQQVLAAAAAASMEPQKQFELFQRATAEAASRHLSQSQSGRSSASSIDSNKNNTGVKRPRPLDSSSSGPTSAKKSCSSTNMKLITKDNQMFVSMEVNGSTYQGILFAVDPAKTDNQDFSDGMNALSALFGGDLSSSE